MHTLTWRSWTESEYGQTATMAPCSVHLKMCNASFIYGPYANAYKCFWWACVCACGQGEWAYPAAHYITWQFQQFTIHEKRVLVVMRESISSSSRSSAVVQWINNNNWCKLQLLLSAHGCSAYFRYAFISSPLSWLYFNLTRAWCMCASGDSNFYATNRSDEHTADAYAYNARPAFIAYGPVGSVRIPSETASFAAKWTKPTKKEKKRKINHQIDNRHL